MWRERANDKKRVWERERAPIYFSKFLFLSFCLWFCFEQIYFRAYGVFNKKKSRIFLRIENHTCQIIEHLQ